MALYRQGGINFLGVFQNAAAQIENRYGKETARIWKKAVVHTIYRGLPDTDTLRDIEHRSGRTSVMVRGFNVNMNQVNGSGDSLAEQSRPLLQVEDIRRATGGDKGLLDSRDHGFFTLDMPNYWERPELSGCLRDVRDKLDRYAWLDNVNPALFAPPLKNADADMEAILTRLRGESEDA
ncbi:TraM recognition domain-containing protein [Mesorhizobium sp. CAU 1732]|uniref:TraM recognition domain-containing protein n=1 Tax=Mesorhizobium sp. CAU 1732 TaxID=3140358 RepID=UPI0032603900